MFTNLFLKDYPVALRKIVTQYPAKLLEQKINSPPINKYLDQRREKAKRLEQALIESERKK
ncbi:MAG: hypothetical protein HRU34_15040 [Richelia sp.]|nr:hypothetical protein [Richelia sp.]